MTLWILFHAMFALPDIIGKQGWEERGEIFLIPHSAHQKRIRPTRYRYIKDS